MIQFNSSELPNRARIDGMITDLLSWLKGYGYDSYDPYDLWATNAGRAVRRFYYRHQGAGALPVLPFLVLDWAWPGSRRHLVRKKRYPIADAHWILGFIERHGTEADPTLVEGAERLARDLLEQSIPGYSGHCWGFPFEWESSGGLIPRGTPLITTTPYCFEAFLKLYELTGNQAYCEVARSAAQFAVRDLNETPISEDASACSYTPRDHSRVINANSYRAMMLLEAHARFGQEESREMGVRNLRFVLQSQRQDGSWVYEPGSRNNDFVDNFHTCFTLKNLVKAQRHLADPALAESIRRGYSYYREHLFRPDGTPRPFAEGRRLQPVRIEGYDVAEGILLGVLLKDEIPGALHHALALAGIASERLRLPEGYFAPRILLGGRRVKVPYLRWPLAQMFHALCLLSSSLKD
jgi:hypothetical protein